ncbi:hypothetical protein MLD52_03055 [Puniceicoccaceae bacterium K14]|nr:hypothetical protein [Puniceicoccaceae bacterium K14]
MLHLKTFKAPKSFYFVGMGCLVTGSVAFAAILFYAILNADKQTSFDTTLNTMGSSVFAAITLMILGTIFRGVKS